MSAKEIANGRDAVERVEPIKITERESGKVYELDFNRETIMFMDSQGFKMNENIFDFPVTNVPKLFFYACRMHQKKMSRGQTDALLEKLGGLSPKVVERLFLLYNQAAQSNNIQDDEELEKNPYLTVEL